MEFQGRKIRAKLNIAKTDSGRTGKWSSERGKSSIEKVTINDEVLTFVQKFEREGQEFLIDYQAKIVDGKPSGKLVSSRGELPFVDTVVENQKEDSEASKLLKSMDGKVSEDERSGG